MYDTISCSDSLIITFFALYLDCCLYFLHVSFSFPLFVMVGILRTTSYVLPLSASEQWSKYFTVSRYKFDVSVNGTVYAGLLCSLLEWIFKSFAVFCFWHFLECPLACPSFCPWKADPWSIVQLWWVLLSDVCSSWWSAVWS